MRKTIRTMLTAGLVITAVLASGSSFSSFSHVNVVEKEPPRAKEPEQETVCIISNHERTGVSTGENDGLLAEDGSTLEERILTPDGYRRVEKERGSFQGYLRTYEMKPHNNPVLLYDGSQKGNQTAQAAVFAMPVFDSDLQQCADSVMRMYGEYFWKMGAYDKIAFHLTNGFLMDYPSWMSGKRLAVNQNHVTWVKKASFDASYDTFLLYLKYVMVYAGTLSLDQECTPVSIGDIQAGDMFIKGGSPGHCVMVADVAENEAGEKCFLLAQGYMPAQEFHVLKNPLHEEDPWYYENQLSYPLETPEYTFLEGSLKRWYGFVQ